MKSSDMNLMDGSLTSTFAGFFCIRQLGMGGVDVEEHRYELRTQCEVP